MTTRTHGAPRRTPRGRADARALVLAALLVALVGLGVLAMHAVPLGAAPGTSAGQQAISASHSADGHSGEPSAAGGAAVGQGLVDHGSAGLGCEGCPADHLGLTVTCLVALLLVLFAVSPPRWQKWSFGRAVRAGPVLSPGQQAPSRPPSLLVLCICRT